MPELTEECIEELNKAIPLTDLLTESPKHRKEYNCILCGSDHHVKIYPEDNRAHCAKCGGSFSAIDVIQKTSGAGFMDVCKDLSGRYGIELRYKDGITPEDRAGIQSMKEKHSTSSTEKEDPEEAPETVQEDTEEEIPCNIEGKYKKPLEDAIKDVDKARDYLHGRGLSDATIDKYRIGYREKQKFIVDKEVVYMPAVVFPYSPEYSYFSARSLIEKHFYKPAAKEAGKEPVFNAAALYDGEPCFVCESILDALSVIEAGGNACATCGTEYGNLIDKIKGTEKSKGKRPAAPLILSYDNDKPQIDEKTGEYKRPGPDAQKTLAKELKALNVPFIEAKYNYRKYLREGKKDANELLLNNRAQLEEDIRSNIAIALDHTGIEALLFSGESWEYEPIPTGIQCLDKFLNGGLIPKTLVLLGAGPGLGKTLIASMVFENVAKAGRKCVYYNYEMSREQLLARSLSRRIYHTANQYKVTATDILQSYNKSETTKELIKEAGEEYKRDVKGNLDYNPPGMSSDVDELLKNITRLADEAEAIGEPAPIICIDYLHLLTGNPGEDPASIIKRAVYDLKQWAIEHDSIVFAIQAQNRQANEKAYATLESGRDTSNLEYSADLVLQLVKPKKPKQGEEGFDTYDPKEVDLCITKSRFTDTNMKGFKFRKLGNISYMEPPEERKKK